MLSLVAAGLAVPTGESPAKDTSLLQVAPKIYKADHPLLLIKLLHSGSSAFMKHLADSEKWEPAMWMQEATYDASEKWKDNHDSYCKAAQWQIVKVLKGENKKYGAASVNPLKQDYDRKNPESSCAWKQLDAIKKAVKSGDLKARPKVALLWRENVVHLAASALKAKVMLEKKACPDPYTENTEKCPWRYKYQFEADPQELLDMVHQKADDQRIAIEVANRFSDELGWGKPAMNFTFEQMVRHGGGTDVGVPKEVTDFLKMTPEDDVKVGWRNEDNSADLRTMFETKPKLAATLLNFYEVQKFFEEKAPEYTEMLMQVGVPTKHD